MTTLRTGDASTEYRVRPLVAADAARLQPLNDAAAPAVPITSARDLTTLVALAALALGVERDDGEGENALVGFVLALAPGAAYESENYRFFESRDVDHLYVDRIVIAESERGRGYGKSLLSALAGSSTTPFSKLLESRAAPRSRARSTSTRPTRAAWRSIVGAASASWAASRRRAAP